MKDLCPHCGADLQGEPIPGDDDRHLSRKVGVEVPGFYDGTAYWCCPDCRLAWEREGFTGYRAERVQVFVADHNRMIRRKRKP